MTRQTGAGARVGGDHLVLFFVEIIGTVLVAVSSFVISFTSLLAVAEWQHTPDDIHFMTAIEIDLPIIVTAALQITFKWREQAFPMWISRAFGWVVTAFSSGVNFMHTVSIGGLTTYEGWIGACLNAFAPISVYLCTELLGHLITRPKNHNTALNRALAKTKALETELRAFRRQAKRTPTFAADVTPYIRGKEAPS